jgi:hypothetical protein
VLTDKTAGYDCLWPFDNVNAGVGVLRFAQATGDGDRQWQMQETGTGNVRRVWCVVCSQWQSKTNADNLIVADLDCAEYGHRQYTTHTCEHAYATMPTISSS